MWYEQLLDHHPAALLLQRWQFRLWYFLITHLQVCGRFTLDQKAGKPAFFPILFSNYRPFFFVLSLLSRFWLFSFRCFSICLIQFSSTSYTLFPFMINRPIVFYSLSFFYKVSICVFDQCGILSILVS